MAIALYARKEIAALPAVLEPNTIYAIRVGLGFDLYISDSTGALAHRVNNTQDPLKSPVFTYNAGSLTGVSYSDGSTKILSYSSGRLAQSDLVRSGVTTRKTFSYSGSVLTSIAEVTL
jgi:hypothetical protein